MGDVQGEVRTINYQIPTTQAEIGNMSEMSETNDSMASFEASKTFRNKIWRKAEMFENNKNGPSFTGKASRNKMSGTEITESNDIALLEKSNVQFSKTSESIPALTTSGVQTICTCTQCGKMFQNLTEWKQHITKVCLQKVKTSSCKSIVNDKELRETSKETLKKRSVWRKAWPSVVGKYVCEQCGMTLKGSCNYYAHIRSVHEKYRPFCCDVCKKRFSTRYQIDNHQVAVHTRKCSTCQTYIAETAPWGKGVSKSTPREVVCGNCGGVVLFYSGTKRSIIEGTERAEKTRNGDDEKQGTEEMLNDNKQEMGTEISSTVLQEMETEISATVSLQRHGRTPRIRNRFACDVCGKLFQNKCVCHRHQQKHSLEKTLICDFCGKLFRHDASLSQHRLKHTTPRRNFLCCVCSKQFVTKFAFKSHMQKKHMIDIKTIPAEKQRVMIAQDVDIEEQRAHHNNYSPEFTHFIAEQELDNQTPLPELGTSSVGNLVVPVDDFHPAGEMGNEMVGETLSEAGVCVEIESTQIDNNGFSIHNQIQ